MCEQSPEDWAEVVYTDGVQERGMLSKVSWIMEILNMLQVPEEQQG